MNNSQRIQLDKMIQESGADDNTELIRELKHSDSIEADLRAIEKVRAENPDVSKESLLAICTGEALFLYSNYTSIFYKAVANELNMGIMQRLLDALRSIEDGTADQHEASVRAGQILKELYVDSALQRANTIDENTEAAPTLSEGNATSWAEFKALQKK